MRNEKFTKAEKLLEHLLEGQLFRAFTNHLHPRLLAGKLARAMEDGLRQSADGTLIAPRCYTITLHTQDYQTLLDAQAALIKELTEYLIRLALDAGYYFVDKPIVKVVSRQDLVRGMVRVEVSDSLNDTAHDTQTMKAVSSSYRDDASSPQNAQLLFGQTNYVALDTTLINIGRRQDNQIVLSDPRISRAHAQIRLRYGRYILYDLGSRGGTFVNEHRVTEHILRPGDVVSFAGITAIYLEDDPQKSNPTRDTNMRPPSDAAHLRDNDPTV